MTRNGPVTVRRINAEALALALTLSGYEPNRIFVVSESILIVVNNGDRSLWLEILKTSFVRDSKSGPDKSKSKRG